MVDTWSKQPTALFMCIKTRELHRLEQIGDLANVTQQGRASKEDIEDAINRAVNYMNQSITKGSVSS